MSRIFANVSESFEQTWAAAKYVGLEMTKHFYKVGALNSGSCLLGMAWTKQSHERRLE